MIDKTDKGYIDRKLSLHVSRYHIGILPGGSPNYVYHFYNWENEFQLPNRKIRRKQGNKIYDIERRQKLNKLRNGIKKKQPV